MQARALDSEFARDVRSGLTRSSQKTLPCRYLYDDVGSALFEAITYLPEYGLTRADARILQDYLKEYGDENAYMCPAEASVGVNARALVRGIQREDKNILGSMHFGLGTNIDVGGSVKSKIHMDGVILQPTLYVDGKMRMESGRFLVPIEGKGALDSSSNGSLLKRAHA